jgi:hypothetical protein
VGTRVRQHDNTEMLGAVAAMAVLAVLVVVILFAWLARVPLREQAAAAVGEGTLLAYSADGETPVVLARQDGVLRLTELHLDWGPLLRLQMPMWHLRSTSMEVAETTDPASMTIIGCQKDDRPCEQSVTLVGEITDPRVEQIEVRVNDEEWHLFARSPGYIKQFPRNVCMDDVRWVDVNGQVVWSVDLMDDEAFDRCLDAR